MHFRRQPAVAISCRPEGLLPITDDAALIVTKLGYRAWENSAKHLTRPQRLLESFAGKHSLLQRNHGAFTIGGEHRQAWPRMYGLMRAREVQLLAMAREGVVDQVPPPATDT